MFRKPLNELTRSDFDELIARGVQEDRTLEFKRTLSGRDGNPDPWTTGADKIGNIAKRDLTKEMVAFANTAGGLLILGMDEDGSKRASGIVELPNCVALADRLSASIAASVDPPLTSLEAVGVELTGEAGVVVFRVPLSHSAPHRDKDERECYHRVGDRSEPMSMRQIQDLSITSARGTQILREKIEDRVRHFELKQPHNAHQLVPTVGYVSKLLCGLQAIAYPLQRIAIDRINEDRRFHLKLPGLRVAGSGANHPGEYSSPEYPQWWPMLRGIRAQDTSSENEEFVQIIRSDGLIEFTCTVSQIPRGNMGMDGLAVPVKDVIYLFAQALIRVQVIRELIGRSELEFLLDFSWTFPEGVKIAYPGVDGFSPKVAAPIEPVNRVSDYEMPKRNEITVLWDRLQRDIAHSFGLPVFSTTPFDFEAAIASGLSSAQCAG